MNHRLRGRKWAHENNGGASSLITVCITMIEVLMHPAVLMAISDFEIDNGYWKDNSQIAK